jgi:hypothetical protein
MAALCRERMGMMMAIIGNGKEMWGASHLLEKREA